MEAILINIGDELLIGQVINTNASWMSARLEEQNIHIKRVITIADDAAEIEHYVDQSIREVPLVLITGGLGPTKDDITKLCLNNYFGGKLITHQPTLEHVKSYFEGKNLPFTEINKAQALVPDCCQVLMNNVGTAPCMWFEKDEHIVVSMPGVPFEMKWLMDHRVLPMLKERWKGAFLIHKTILTSGIGESFLADRIAAWEDALPHYIKLAYLPDAGRVRLRLSGEHKDQAYLEQVMEQEIEKLKPLISDYLYGYNDDTLASVIGEILTREGKWLATAESCSGGCIGHRITEVPGASNYYCGGVISYSNQIKEQVLGVDAEILEKHGAVSRETAEAMAQGVRKLMGSDYAIATTGIAGPTGGSEEKPVGTVWIAVAGPNAIHSECYRFQTIRSQHQERTTNQALFNLWTMIH